MPVKKPAAKPAAKKKPVKKSQSASQAQSQKPKQSKPVKPVDIKSLPPLPEGRDEKGRFMPKNEFWKARTTVPPERIFKTPEELSAACFEYFQWVDENPLYEMRPFAYQGHVVQDAVPLTRAMSIGGLCIYIGTVRSNWYAMKETRPDLLDIMDQVEHIIYDQKFTAASANLLNANIIARDLGLTEKTDITSNGKQIVNEYHIHPVTTKKSDG